jgi:hypothetical protein
MEKKVIRITFGKKNLGSTKLDKKKRINKITSM